MSSIAPAGNLFASTSAVSSNQPYTTRAEGELGRGACYNLMPSSYGRTSAFE